MGWWELANGDEIGDQAADLVRQALEGLRREPAAHTTALPTVDRFLQALATALSLARRGEGPPAAQGLRVTGADGNAAIYPAQTVPDDLATWLGGVLAALVDCYKRYLGRPPRPAELGAVFAFVLRVHPERFLADAEGWQLRRIEPLD